MKDDGILFSIADENGQPKMVSLSSCPEAERLDWLSYQKHDYLVTIANHLTVLLKLKTEEVKNLADLTIQQAKLIDRLEQEKI